MTVCRSELGLLSVCACLYRWVEVKCIVLGFACVSIYG